MLRELRRRKGGPQLLNTLPRDLARDGIGSPVANSFAQGSVADLPETLSCDETFKHGCRIAFYV